MAKLSLLSERPTHIAFITQYIMLLHKQKHREKYSKYKKWTGLWKVRNNFGCLVPFMSNL